MPHIIPYKTLFFQGREIRLPELSGVKRDIDNPLLFCLNLLVKFML